MVPTFAVVAKTLVVVTAFAAYRLFDTFRVSTFAVVANRFVVVTAFAAYRLFETFAVVTNRLVVVTAFDTKTFPSTVRFDVTFSVPIPTPPR